MLYDAFVYPVNAGVNFPHPKFIVECPASATQTLLKHLKRYVLRSKVKIRDVTEEYTPWSIWGDALNHEHASTMDKVPAGLLIKKDTRLSDIGCHDPRVPGFGYRAVLPNTQGTGAWTLWIDFDFALTPKPGPNRHRGYLARRFRRALPRRVYDPAHPQWYPRGGTRYMA